MPEAKDGVKTLGIRLPNALHSQFALTAQVDDISLGDAALRAVELYVATKKAEPDFAARAQAALDAIEEEAAARRAAIQSLFGVTEPAATGTSTTSPRGRKPQNES